jgi:hypothetical protein
MSGENVSKLQGSDVHLSVGGDAASVAKELGDEPKRATRDLVDLVTEATWNEALSQLGGLPSNPLPLWTLLAAQRVRGVGQNAPSLRV